MCSECDVFSLSSVAPISSIPQKDKEDLLKNHLVSVKKLLKERYDYFSETEKNLPDFETVFHEIVDECESFYKNLCFKNENKLKHDGSPFICDHVGKDTKYSKPLNLFWHFYHEIQNAMFSLSELQKLPSCEKFDIHKIITDQQDAILIKNFIKYEYTYSTHCTIGILQLVLYFKLNDKTKNWLMQFKTDFDLENSNFEDLAIYKKDKIEFSSCTHERFNSINP